MGDIEGCLNYDGDGGTGSYHCEGAGSEVGDLRKIDEGVDDPGW